MMGSSTILSVGRSYRQKGRRTSLATRGLHIPELNHNIRRVCGKVLNLFFAASQYDD